jgi:hypothetical protein
MSLVGAATIKAYLCIAGQFQFAGPSAVIDQRYGPHLSIGAWGHADGPTSFNVADQTTEIGSVGLKLEFEFTGILAKWLISKRPGFVFG